MEAYDDATIEGWFSFGEYSMEWEFHCEDEEHSPYIGGFPYVSCWDGEIYWHIPA